MATWCRGVGNLGVGVELFKAQGSELSGSWAGLPLAGCREAYCLVEVRVPLSELHKSLRDDRAPVSPPSFSGLIFLNCIQTCA